MTNLKMQTADVSFLRGEHAEGLVESSALCCRPRLALSPTLQHWFASAPSRTASLSNTQKKLVWKRHAGTSQKKNQSEQFVQTRSRSWFLSILLNRPLNKQSLTVRVDDGGPSVLLVPHTPTHTLLPTSERPGHPSSRRSGIKFPKLRGFF